MGLSSNPPTLEAERGLLGAPGAGGPRIIAGMDEVGRGALAGPVTVGVTVVGRATAHAPDGLRDSKLLRPARRETLVPQIRQWALADATGSASAQEIDAVGIVGALRLAGRRALAALGPGHRPDLVLLDGSHDWLSDPGEPPASAAEDGGRPDASGGGGPGWDAPGWDGPVRTVVKGDLTCASIAAASVLAKVSRDAVMVALDPRHPAYGWGRNKGYGAAGHRAALRELGATQHHRRSWNLGLPG